MSSTITELVRLDAAFLRGKHVAGLSYERYLAADPAKAANWRRVDQQVNLTADQRRLIEGCTREMKVLCVSGIWCGDCVAQGPLLQKIADANPRMIDLKWLERDTHLDLAEAIKVNAGLRVPMVIFMAEDHEPVSILGDRSLTRYRALAAKHLGAACPLPGAPIPTDELNATLQDWLAEFERVHLLLRLSGRLREKHGD